VYAGQQAPALFGQLLGVGQKFRSLRRNRTQQRICLQRLNTMRHHMQVRRTCLVCGPVVPQT
jgi:hypothetical protein